MSVLAYNQKIELWDSQVCTFHIYVLKNPFDNEIFYVGKTAKDLKVRLSGHLSNIGDISDKIVTKSSYIKKILDNGGKPIIEAIETIYCTCYIDKIKATERELYWIKHFRLAGSPLTNIAGMEDDSRCKEYHEYIESIKSGKASWHFYYCGKNKYGVKVYDEERLNDDGFTFPSYISERTPDLSQDGNFVEKVTYDKCYDDDDPDYIRSSQEEI